MSNEEAELKSSYKENRDNLKKKLDNVIAKLGDMQQRAVDDGDQERADKCNDLLQKANAARTLLIITCVYDLAQTDVVQDAIEQLKKAKADLDKVTRAEGLSDPDKLQKAKEVFESLKKVLDMIKEQLDKE